MCIFFLLYTAAALQAGTSSFVGTYGDCKKVTPSATHLKIVDTEIEVFGKKAKVFEILPNGIEKEEGGCFDLIVENQTSVPTGLHWHGLILPWHEDGVSYVTQPPIPAGKTYGYNFKVVQDGSFWMHSHFGLQEQRLMAAPLILRKKGEEKQHEVVMFIEDFTFTPTEQIWLNLRKDLVATRKAKGQGWKPELDPPMKKHGASDLNDVDYDAFLVNRKDITRAPVEEVEPGEKILLRIMDASASSSYHIDLGELKGMIVAADGEPVVPVSFQEFPIAVAQRYDVEIEIPKREGAWPVLARAQGTNQQTALILKTKRAKTPKLFPIAKTTIGAITNLIEKDLRAKNPLKPRKVDRTLNVTLDGTMKYYTWALNRNIWPHNVPLKVKEGERVAIVFENKTQMSHPMHLHGHVFQVVEIDGDHFSGAMRDTVLVMPNQKVTIEFDAFNPGIWAMHCHIIYHLWAGMFTVVQYEGISPLFTEKQVVEYSRIYGGY